MNHIIATKNYSIHIDNTSYSPLKSWIQESSFSSLFILVDENTKEHCLPLFLQKSGLKQVEIIEIKSGELNKTLETCTYIWQQLTEKGADRKSLFINLGGGVIGDMGGFCASTFKRGMAFVQIPTTLLSQVDASIGGKLGIDFHSLKNHIGLFCDPRMVLVDVDYLNTLPGKQIRSGYAEIVKHALISDLDFWKDLQAIHSISNVSWEAFLPRSIQIKKEVVEKDPFESGLRQILNFGHTIGHAIESIALNSKNPLLHGEAVAIGMICEAYISEALGYIRFSELEQITNHLQDIFPNYSIDESWFPAIKKTILQDKKNQRNQINFALLKKVGMANFGIAVNFQMIEESIRFYIQRNRQ